MAKLNRGGEKAMPRMPEALSVQLMEQVRPEPRLPERHEADSVPRVRARPNWRRDSLLRDQHAKAVNLGEGCKADAIARQPHLLQECAMKRRTSY